MMMINKSVQMGCKDETVFLVLVGGVRRSPAAVLFAGKERTRVSWVAAVSVPDATRRENAISLDQQSKDNRSLL
jgi:hypothetical protein